MFFNYLKYHSQKKNSIEILKINIFLQFIKRYFKVVHNIFHVPLKQIYLTDCNFYNSLKHHRRNMNTNILNKYFVQFINCFLKLPTLFLLDFTFSSLKLYIHLNDSHFTN